MVQYGVDLLFADSIPAAKAAQMMTTRIPIVFIGLGGNPVEMGLIESFDRPGGNIMGISMLVIELAPKRLELFRDLVPGLHRVLFPYDANDASGVAEAKVYREAAHRLGIVLVERAIQTQAEAQAILTQVWKGEIDGILLPANVSLNIAGFIAETAGKQSIPTMTYPFLVDQDKGLASYGGSFGAGRQAARLVDKILKGTKPADTPKKYLL